MALAQPNFDDPTLWEVHPAVVWDEHEDTLRDGTARRFTKEDLERIAENCNRRDRQRVYAAITLGHTRPGRPEQEQPRHMGWARHFEVDYDADLQRYVIRCKYYFKKELAEEARKYPRTSVEYWRSDKDPEDDFFDPIAIGIQTSRLDIPPWTYSGRPGFTCTRYSMSENDMPEPEKKEGEKPPEAKKPKFPPKEKGAMPEEHDEHPEHPEAPPQAPPGAPDPTKPPDANAPEPEFHAKCMNSLHHAYPHLAAMHEKYTKEMEAAQPGMDADGLHKGETKEAPEQFGALSATNGVIPAPVKHPEQHQRNGSTLPPEVEKRIKALEEENRKWAKLYQRAEREKELTKIHKEEGLIFDVNEELTDVEDMNPEQYSRHLTRLRRLSKYQMDPTHGEMLNVDVDRDGGRGNGDISTADLDRALQYQRKTGCSWEDAEAHITKR